MIRSTTLPRLILTCACALLFTCALLFAYGCAATAGQTAGERARCPAGTDDTEMFCAQIPRWARDPDTGQCCRYASHCATPSGWKTYPTEDACEAASDD